MIIQSQTQIKHLCLDRSDALRPDDGGHRSQQGAATCTGPQTNPPSHCPLEGSRLRGLMVSPAQRWRAGSPGTSDTPMPQLRSHRCWNSNRFDSGQRTCVRVGGWGGGATAVVPFCLKHNCHGGFHTRRSFPLCARMQKMKTVDVSEKKVSTMILSTFDFGGFQKQKGLTDVGRSSRQTRFFPFSVHQTDVSAAEQWQHSSCFHFHFSFNKNRVVTP